MSRFSEKFKRRADRVRYRARLRSYGKPRLSVFRSGRHIYAQVIDDVKMITLCSVSTLDKNFRGTKSKSSCVEAAQKIGVMLAGKAVEAGIKEVVFDRGGCQYHGRVKALADGARSGGLVF